MVAMFWFILFEIYSTLTLAIKSKFIPLFQVAHPTPAKSNWNHSSFNYNQSSSIRIRQIPIRIR